MRRGHGQPTVARADADVLPEVLRLQHLALPLRRLRAHRGSWLHACGCRAPSRSRPRPPSLRCATVTRRRQPWPPRPPWRHPSGANTDDRVQIGRRNEHDRLPGQSATGSRQMGCSWREEGICSLCLPTASTCSGPGGGVGNCPPCPCPRGPNRLALPPSLPCSWGRLLVLVCATPAASCFASHGPPHHTVKRVKRPHTERERCGRRTTDASLSVRVELFVSGGKSYGKQAPLIGPQQRGTFSGLSSLANCNATTVFRRGCSALASACLGGTHGAATHRVSSAFRLSLKSACSHAGGRRTRRESRQRRWSGVPARVAGVGMGGRSWRWTRSGIACAGDSGLQG